MALNTKHYKSTLACIMNFVCFLTPLPHTHTHTVVFLVKCWAVQQEELLSNWLIHFCIWGSSRFQSTLWTCTVGKHPASFFVKETVKSLYACTTAVLPTHMPMGQYSSGVKDPTDHLQILVYLWHLIQYTFLKFRTLIASLKCILFHPYPFVLVSIGKNIHILCISYWK